MKSLTHLSPIGQVSLLIILLSVLYIKSNAQITEIYTDFGGYWKSTTTANSSTQPNLSHNVLAFTYSGTTYSTGVNDAILTAHSVTNTAGTFKALPISSIGGTIASGNSTFILLPSSDDGVANGTANPLPSVRMNDVLTDGTNGLNIGSGVTNIPVNASMSFPVSNIVNSAISDSKPDILYSQIAATGGNSDSLYFVTASGTRVGSAIGVAWGAVPSLGNHSTDLYTLTNGATCDAAVITGVNATANQKEIRLTAFKLSEFGITAANASTVATLKIKPGGASDPAFVAYNADAFFIATPVITTNPQSQVVCPSSNQNATFTVVATGTGLTYQWRKNGVTISGATSSTYTISNVVAADAASYDVVVTNTAGSVQSQVAYLNTYITSQPLPATQTIATGNSVTLSITAFNANSYQWKRNGVDISGATSSTYTINPLTTTNGGTFTVSVINNSNSGCATLLSSAAVVTPTTTLYSKTTTLNAVSNWTVNSDGSNGSYPVDFTRTEHTFIVRSNASTNADLTIAGTLDVKNAAVTITPGTTLTAGKITRSGTTGSLIGSSTSNITVGSSGVTGNSDLYFNSGNQTLKNLTVATGGNVTLRNGLNIVAGSSSGTLTVNSGATFNTSDSLVLKSDASGTAKVGNSAGTITGKATVERYITAKRAWRLLTAPVTNSNTIYNSWQNNGVYTSGKGTLITMPTPVTVNGGMDQGINANYSMKTFNTATQALSNIVNTNAAISPTNTGSADNIGYFIFVRGDRNPATVANPTLTVVPVCSTTLSALGNLQTGNQVFAGSSVAGKLALIGNPYASPVDFSNLTLKNVIRRFYVWDPSINVSGAYVLMDDADEDGIYDKTITASAQTKVIQSGQAFYVQSIASAPASVTFTESAKSTTNTPLVFRPANATAALRVNFSLSEDSLVDATLAQFNNSFSPDVDWQDASKLANSNEGVSLIRNNKSLSIERRPILTENDTLFIKLAGTTARSYHFNFIPENLSNDLEGTLVDNYLHTTIPVSLIDSTSVDFAVTTEAASTGANRFMLIFKPAMTLPVKFVSVQAAGSSSGNTINWQMSNQTDVSKYVVEKSTDGKTFMDLTIINATTSPNYATIDKTVTDKNNFYRIKSIESNGTVDYSSIVKVSADNTGSISLYPNPIINNNTEIQISNMQKGIYKLRLTDACGKTIYSKEIKYTGGSAKQSLSPGTIGKGSYLLQIQKPDNSGETIKLIN
ncbi:immunoglobulin domain-containing protein [Ferruginibacter albus]|uniref:immunoglobulin domain-containing protein n=1 Tax=Ferruginibacter albus TaxID=2875540 RepID=UPI001CC55D4D|nr:immunoglobulin domain-containing protein [Ferruginibacter albus]UAY51556.1 T9SS type A sorting domain-containing protein [Ferruginibacter albus]